jgi:hypothetical protein
MGKLNLLNGWASIESYFTRRSAQSYLNSNQMAMAASGCSSSCGGDDAKPQPSACGAGDDAKPQPSACGAGDDSQPKPSACGAGDGK